MMLGVMFRLNLVWRDLRLKYNNIRPDQYLVRMSAIITLILKQLHRMMSALASSRECGFQPSVSTMQRLEELIQTSHQTGGVSGRLYCAFKLFI